MDLISGLEIQEVFVKQDNLLFRSTLRCGWTVGLPSLRLPLYYLWII